jgi:phosphohistidine phosphatase
MLRLVLLRHADAEEKAARPDFERRLTAQGQAEASRIGSVLAGRGLHPAAMLSSPATRAIATAVLAAPPLGFPIDRIATDPSVYDATAETLLQAVRRAARGLAPEACLVLVGHNPGLRDLAMLLSGANDPRLLPKATAALLTLDSWERLGAGAGRLETVLGPDERSG